MRFERKKKNTKITNLRHYLPAFNNGGVSNGGKHLFLTKLNSRNCFQREITLFITNWLFEYLIMSDFLLFIKKKKQYLNKTYLSYTKLHQTVWFFSCLTIPFLFTFFGSICLRNPHKTNTQKLYKTIANKE